MDQNLEPQFSRGLGVNNSQRTNTNFSFPTEVISLPSKGLVYSESNPLSKGELTIKLLTAKEEDILTSPNLIKKGIHLDRLLESIVVEPGVNINDLIVAGFWRHPDAKEFDESFYLQNNLLFQYEISKFDIEIKFMCNR